jgi:hypothetical protein
MMTCERCRNEHFTPQPRGIKACVGRALYLNRYGDARLEFNDEHKETEIPSQDERCYLSI